MKVSIVVPVYNVETYIAECAESLFSQDYTNIEYIFVDDYSLDNSIQILQDTITHHPQRRCDIQILHHEQNLGLGAARLTGTLAASGNAIMHVDSDDKLPPHAVTILVQEMQKTDADIVEGSHNKYCKGSIFDLYEPRKISKRKYIKMMLCQDITIYNIWAKLYKRTLFFDNNVLPTPGIDYAEDFCITPRLFDCASKVSYTNQVVYLYRIDNTTSYTHKTNKKNVLSCIKANNMIFDYFKGKRDFSFALKIGMINNWRKFRLNEYDWNILDSELKYVPNSAFEKILTRMFRSRCPFFICNIIFKSIRNFYCIFST